MNKCLGLLLATLLGGTTWAASSSMTITILPNTPAVFENIQVRVDLFIGRGCQITTQVIPRNGFELFTLDLFETCPGGNKAQFREKVFTGLGPGFFAGKHTLIVRHFVNPCRDPKCTRCRRFVGAIRPQLVETKTVSFNVGRFRASTQLRTQL